MEKIRKTGIRKPPENNSGSGADRFRNAFDNARQAILWISYPDGFILNANRAAETLLDTDRDTLLRKRFPDFYSRKLSDAFLEEFVENLVGNQGSVMESELMTGSETRKRVRFFTNVTTIGGQQVIQLTLHDVTGQIRREQASREMSENFDLLLRHSPDMIMIVSREGRVLFLNRTVSGDDPGKYIGEQVSEYLSGKYRDRFDQALNHVFHFHLPDSFEHPALNETWWTTRVVPVDVDGAVDAALIISTDITRRKQAETALKRSRERLRKQFQGLPVPTYILRLRDDGFIMGEYNEAAFEVSGGKVASDVGKRVGETFPNLEGIEKYLQNCIRDKTSEMREFTHVDPQTEQTRHYLVKMGPVPPDIVILHVEDFTDRKRLEDDVQRGARIEAIGVLAGGIAHDFNNLLLGILGNISIARQSVTSPEDILRHLELAEASCDQAVQLTRQLLTFSRGGEPVRIRMALDPVIHDAVDFALGDSVVACDYRFSPDLKDVIMDRGQIIQVLTNIIANARTAMSDRGEIQVKAWNFDYSGDREGSRLDLQPGEYVAVEIRDSGPGIPPQELSHIFEPSFSGVSGGIELSRAITYSIIRKHGGTITVDSFPGQGVTVTFYLPAAEEGPCVPAVDLPESLPLSEYRVLLMDDNSMVRETAGNMLTALGYQVAPAVSGEVAVVLFRDALAAGNPFDIVILDAVVPGGMGGLETFREMKKLSPEITAVITSGYTDDPLMTEFREHGFAACVAKPYHLGELQVILERLIRQRD